MRKSYPKFIQIYDLGARIRFLFYLDSLLDFTTILDITAIVKLSLLYILLAEKFSEMSQFEENY
jgi:hypothetical protein